MANLSQRAHNVATNLAANLGKRGARDMWKAGVKGIATRQKQRRTAAVVLVAALAYLCSHAVTTHNMHRAESRMAAKLETSIAAESKKTIRWVAVAKKAGLAIVAAQATVVLGNMYFGHRAMKVVQMISQHRIGEKIRSISKLMRRGRQTARVATAPITLPVKIVRWASRLLRRPFRRRSSLPDDALRTVATAAAASAGTTAAAAA